MKPTWDEALWTRAWVRAKMSTLLDETAKAIAALDERKIATLDQTSFSLAEKSRFDANKKTTNRYREIGMTTKRCLLLPVVLHAAFSFHAEAEPLTEALEAGRTQEIVGLINAGADVNETDVDGATLLMKAATEGGAKVLIEHGAKIGKADKFGRTAIYWAADRGRTGVVDLLLRHGAAIDAQDNNGETPLIASVGKDDTTASLLDHGAKIDLADKEGNTALLEAAKLGWDGSMKLLLERGADVNRQNSAGETALMLLIGENFSTEDAHELVEKAKLLIENGADLDLKNKDGDTASAIASYWNTENYWTQKKGNNFLGELMDFLKKNAGPAPRTARRKSAASKPEAALEKSPVPASASIHDARLALESEHYQKAAVLFEPLARAGDDIAQAYLGHLYAEGEGVTQDYEKAAELLNKAAKAGNYIAACNLGMLYSSGDGVTKDPKEAVRLFQSAAEAGSVTAMVFLSLHYASGDGVSQNFSEAYRWMKKAADAGELGAPYNLALFYIAGIGVTKDNNEARAWFRKTLNSNDKNPDQRVEDWVNYTENWQQRGLKVIDTARVGATIPSNSKDAFEWFKNLAAAEDPYAQLALGEAAEKGLGVPKDIEEAASLYAKASAKGLGRADKALQSLADHGLLNSSQVARLRAKSQPNEPDQFPARNHSSSTSAPPTIISDVDKPSYKSPENEKNFAVVVGVENYNALPAAQFAERDAESVRVHLLALGYPQRNIALLTGMQATKTGIIKNVETWLGRMSTSESTVFFYYSGHGTPDMKTGLAYLLPADGDPEYLEDTAYPVKRLYESLARLKAKRVIVALDSCFSGTGGRSVLAKGTRPLVAKVELGSGLSEKIAVLTASQSDQTTGAIEEQGHGLFTYYFLRGLNGAAKDQNGKITLRSLYDYVVPNVQDAAKRHNRDQTPVLEGPSKEPLVRFR